MGEEWLRVFENRVVRRMFGPKGRELTGNRQNYVPWRVRNLYLSTNAIMIIKLRG
jgi:hypothetical protein